MRRLVRHRLRAQQEKTDEACARRLVRQERFERGLRKGVEKRDASARCAVPKRRDAKFVAPERLGASLARIRVGTERARRRRRGRVSSPDRRAPRRSLAAIARREAAEEDERLAAQEATDAAAARRLAGELRDERYAEVLEKTLRDERSRKLKDDEARGLAAAREVETRVVRARFVERKRREALRAFGPDGDAAAPGDRWKTALADAELEDVGDAVGLSLRLPDLCDVRVAHKSRIVTIKATRSAGALRDLKNAGAAARAAGPRTLSMKFELVSEKDAKGARYERRRRAEILPFGSASKEDGTGSPTPRASSSRRRSPEGRDRRDPARRVRRYDCDAGYLHVFLDGIRLQRLDEGKKDEVVASLRRRLASAASSRFASLKKAVVGDLAPVDLSFRGLGASPQKC